MSKTLTQIPPAKALVNGIRAIGYSFPTAVADIIDNSITAGAKAIDIISEPLVEEPYFAILDNGCGMNRSELLNAMNFGSNRDDKEDCEQDLGRFGLGLKSASLSQCRRFCVASKRYGRLHAMQYDLDQIEETNDWQLTELDDNEINNLPEIDKLKAYETGTIVIWKEFDKLENAAEDFEKSFRDIVAQTKKHVEFVFHRFYHQIDIRFNFKKIEERDPFLKSSEGRQRTGRTTPISIDGEIITVVPHTLPFANSLTQDEKRLLGNPKSIYDDQGFYIYRNRRLIYWGSWMYMGYKSELNKLARVQIDIPSSLDKLWMLDVKKSYAKIPDKIKEQIRIAVEDSVVSSKRVVRYPGKKEQSETKKIWTRIKNDRDGSVKYEINREAPNIQALNSILGETEKRLFSDIINQIECYLPKFSLVNDNADSIFIANTGEDREDDVVKRELIDMVKSFPMEQWEIMLDDALDFEAYKQLKSQREQIVKELY